MSAYLVVFHYRRRVSSLEHWSIGLKAGTGPIDSDGHHPSRVGTQTGHDESLGIPSGLSHAVYESFKGHAGPRHQREPPSSNTGPLSHAPAANREASIGHSKHSSGAIVTEPQLLPVMPTPLGAPRNGDGVQVDVEMGLAKAPSHRDGGYKGGGHTTHLFAARDGSTAGTPGLIPGSAKSPVGISIEMGSPAKDPHIQPQSTKRSKFRSAHLHHQGETSTNKQVSYRFGNVPMCQFVLFSCLPEP